MMKSIRLKLTLMLSGFVLLIVGLFVLLNTQYLRTYFIAQNETGMREVAQQISTLKNQKQALADIGLKRGMRSVVFDENMEIVTVTHAEGSPEIEFVISAAQVFFEQENSSMYTVTEGTRPELIVYITVMPDGSVLALSKPSGPIVEFTYMANDFVQMVGIGCFLLSIVVAILLARSFAKPMVKLNKMAGHIANLEFDDRFEVKGKDEIQRLGQSMNTISVKLHQAIDELKDDIKKKEIIDSMRKEFVANVSHEIKSPVGLITGYSEMLLKKEKDLHPKTKSYIDTIYSEAFRINEISSKLLLLAGLESRKEDLKEEQINVSVLVYSILRKHEVNLVDYSIKEQVESDVMIVGDATLMEIAINNLIVNAIKYSSERRLEVEVTNDKICVTNPCDNLQEEELEFIWTHFYKADKARSRDKGSVGLGLAIVRTILNLHGFECTASLEDGNVTFCIFFT